MADNCHLYTDSSSFTKIIQNVKKLKTFNRVFKRMFLDTMLYYKIR